MSIKHGSNITILTKQYESDIEAIIAKRYDNGADLWTTTDKRIGKGSPFSTLGRINYFSLNERYC